MNKTICQIYKFISIYENPPDYPASGVRTGFAHRTDTDADAGALKALNRGKFIPQSESHLAGLFSDFP